jgi:hypothetical protein
VAQLIHYYGGGGSLNTPTEAVAILLPWALVAVNVYMVDPTGIIVMLPETPTSPTPLSIVTAVVFVVLQLKVTELPKFTLFGLIIK